MDRLAHKCVSLQFLIDFNGQVVQPFCPTMTVKQFVDDIHHNSVYKPAAVQLRRSVTAEHVVCVAPHAFVSKSCLWKPSLCRSTSRTLCFQKCTYGSHHQPAQSSLVERLWKRLSKRVNRSLFVWIRKPIQLFRLWCLYEIGSTPIEKLVLLNYGFDTSELLGTAYERIDASTADFWAQIGRQRNDSKPHILLDMMQMQMQGVVGSEATVEEGLHAFTRVLFWNPRTTRAIISQHYSHGPLSMIRIPYTALKVSAQGGRDWSASLVDPEKASPLYLQRWLAGSKSTHIASVRKQTRTG